MELKSYRSSHIGENRGTEYDRIHSRKMDAVIWKHFVRPYVARQMENCRARGGEAFLDFACGTGRLLKVGAEHFETCVGIDISEDMLSVARERVPTARFYCMDVTSGQDDVVGSFDCVTLFRFLLNAEKELSIAALSWLHAHMRPGSMLIGNNHMHSGSARGLVTIAANRLLRTRHNHLSTAEMTQMLSQCGFRVLTWAGFRVIPTWGGKALLGREAQLRAEQLAAKAKLQRFGSEQVFVAIRE